jgi:hypothetical protein
MQNPSGKHRTVPHLPFRMCAVKLKKIFEKYPFCRNRTEQAPQVVSAVGWSASHARHCKRARTEEKPAFRSRRGYPARSERSKCRPRGLARLGQSLVEEYSSNNAIEEFASWVCNSGGLFVVLDPHQYRCGGSSLACFLRILIAGHGAFLTIQLVQ